MGYSTSFSGELKFSTELTASQLAYLSSLLDEDRRDHPEWKAPDAFYYVALELTEDFSGLRWNGQEKTYGMDAIVNTVIRLMRERWEDFGLVGRMDAQGEDIGDVWALIAEGDSARKLQLMLEGRHVECPHCEQEFVLDAKVIEQPTESEQP